MGGWKARIGAAIALAGLTPQAAGAASPTYLFARPGADAAVVQADEAVCDEKARHAPVPVVPYQPPPVNSGVAGGIAAGLANGIIQGIERARAERAAKARCMRSQGYVRIRLTPEETAALKGQHGDGARSAWLAGFYGGDLAARLAAAAHPVVPAFEELDPAPFAVGGVQIDPASIKVTAEPVAVGATLASATAVHRRTAIVKGGYYTGSEPGEGTTIEDGAIFHQIDNPFPDPDSPSLWCGMATNHAPLGHPTLAFCISTGLDGYDIRFANQSQPWLASGPNLPAQLFRRRLTRPIDFVASDRDLLGPMQVLFVASQIAKDAVTLEAYAFKDGKKVLVWRGRRPLDARGEASAPFWSKRLVLKPQGKLVQATLAPDGDGAGLDTAAD